MQNLSKLLSTLYKVVLLLSTNFIRPLKRHTIAWEAMAWRVVVVSRWTWPSYFFVTSLSTLSFLPNFFSLYSRLMIIRSSDYQKLRKFLSQKGDHRKRMHFWSQIIHTMPSVVQFHFSNEVSEYCVNSQKRVDVLTVQFNGPQCRHRVAPPTQSSWPHLFHTYVMVLPYQFQFLFVRLKSVCI